MKDQSQAAIQFSGYPLRIVEPKQKTRQEKSLMAVPPATDLKTTFIQANKISNDPLYWDLTWFNCYE